MIENFESLNQDELNQLKDAVALIGVLIAGADGNIDAEEKAWAEKIAAIRSYSEPVSLNSFYKFVGASFNEDFANFSAKLPKETDSRNKEIEERLSAINPTMHKLSPKVAASLYKSYVSFAEHVAKASGGFMRFFSVSSEEKKWLNLPMLEVFEMPEEEEE